MSALIDTSNGQANIAFLGSRADIWHRMGQEMKPNMSIDEWAVASGLNWTSVKAPAGAFFNGEWRQVPDRFFNTRSDTGHILGPCSDVYQNVQPREVLDWFDRYISVDDRFQLDVAGSLKQGEIIWATAVYRDPITVAGDKHLARLLMTTTFDGSRATINQGTMTRAVCKNTIATALADTRAVIKTRHNTKFDPARVGKELAQIATGFEEFKKMGDGLARVEMKKEEISNFFKACLDIPFDARAEDISTRKMNQFDALGNAYRATVAEGTEAGTAWASLNAITRYVDHERGARGNGVSAEEKQFTSAQFGSGASMKSKAVELLLAKMEAQLGDRAPVLVGADTMAALEARL